MGLFFWLGSAREVGVVSCCLVVVTAADRAAATCQRLVQYKFISGGPKGWRGRSESCQTGSVHRLAPAGAKSPYAAKVAAALSAAVTTIKQEGTEPTSQAEPTKKKHTPPNASRSSGEGVWGRGASLREAASPPEFPPPSSSRWVGQPP